MGLVYEIRLAEPPEPAWVEQLAGWEVQAHPDGGSLLRGEVAEHASLLDVHTRVQRMGLTLLELRQAESPGHDPGEALAGLRRRLQEQEALWRLTFDLASDAMGIRDADGRTVDANPAFVRMHGYAREELIGTASSGLKDAEDIRRYALYLEAIRTGQRFHTTGRNRHKDGTRFPVEVHGYPFALGGAPHMLTVIRDATGEVRAFEQAQERAQTSARELTALLEVARQVTSSLDLSPLLRTILAQLRVVFDYAGASIFLREGPDELALTVYEGPIPEAKLPTRWSIGPRRPEGAPLEELIAEAEQAHPAAFGREVIYSGEPVIIPDISADTPLARAYRRRLSRLLDDEVPDYIGCWMGVPLIYRDEVLGLLDFDHERPGYYTPHHARLAFAAATQATIAIVHARLLAERELLAAQEERQRLARDLHDAVTQQLFSASLIGEVLPQIWAANPAKGAEYLEDLRLLTKGALAEMRALLVELRPSALTDTPLPDLLQHLVAALGGRVRIPVELQVTGARPLPADLQVALYRIAQEALQNIAKHAKASRAWVLLQLSPGAVALEIRDDGRGFDATRVPADHFGLQIMRERMAAVGGGVTLESQPGQGTRLRAQWPARASGEDA